MKKLFALMVLLSALLFSLTCIATEKNENKETVEPEFTHPELTEQEKLQPCFECHKEVTPDIYSEWQESLHGIGMVKCYQCHGTFENMKRIPETSNCRVCHAAQMEKCPQDKKCWSCHKAHTFKLDSK